MFQDNARSEKTWNQVRHLTHEPKGYHLQVFNVYRSSVFKILCVLEGMINISGTYWQDNTDVTCQSQCVPGSDSMSYWS
jgi:hypothetical protein